MQMRAAVFSVLAGLLLQSEVAPPAFGQAAPTCSPEAQAALLEPAVSRKETVKLDCSPRLDSDDVITRTIILEGPKASGVTLDCKGGHIGRADSTRPLPSRILVRSHWNGSAWQPPEGIVIRNCQIFGSIGIRGMSTDRPEGLKQSSFSTGHTERAQNAAPRDIILDNLDILPATRTTPLYVSAGVTGVTLRNSRIRGNVWAIAIYLDAESARNVIEGNDINIQTGREVIAVDGSAYNRISGNKITLTNRDGIHLYRNCGERGIVRHQTPSFNTITDNEFVFTTNRRTRTVHENARNSRRNHLLRQGRLTNCDLDAGHPFGSSADNYDNASNNTILRNTARQQAR